MNKKEEKSILITIHGGCFVGGNSSYDKAQTKFLLDIGFEVHQIDFVKTNLTKCLEDIENQIFLLKEKNPYSKFFVLGRSSGGYIAKVLFDLGHFSKALYIAPVFDPILRGEKIKNLGEKAKSFFEGVNIYPTTKWNKEKEKLLLTKTDENIGLFYSRTIKLLCFYELSNT
jgi:hypothetical protein